MLCIISYDLHSNESNRSKIINAINNLGNVNWILSTTCIVSANMSLAAVSDTISKLMSPDDKFIACLIQSGNDIAGNISLDKLLWLHYNE